MASELENTIRDLESMACSCDVMNGMVCEAHKVAQHLRDMLKPVVQDQELVTGNK